MNIRTLAFLLTFVFLNVLPADGRAANRSNYLPLKTDALLELELEKLSSVAKMPILSKPYHIATVQLYLASIRESNPELYGRISRYLARYKGAMNLTHFNLELSYSTFDHKVIPNSRGRTTGSHIASTISGYWNFAENFSLSLGGTFYDDDNLSNGKDNFIPNNTYLSYTQDYFQIDLGYKEIWYSPFQESAMLLSTQAKPIARIAVSSPRPLSDWNIQYAISYGQLDQQQGIRFGDEFFAGKPGFITMHTSFQPFDWWTLGGTRTLVFGGGPRDIGLSQVWQAIIDPVSGDNCGGASSLQNCELEAGNQQASVSSKFDFNWGMPLSIYAELAGEDTNNFKAYSLGNKAFNLGFFLPYLTDRSSLLLEYQLVQEAWYVHHLYQEGYRNNLNSMGHWWGDEKLLNDGIGARIITLRYNWEVDVDYHFDLKLASIDNANLGDEANSDPSIYQQGYEMTLGLNDTSEESTMRYEVYLGTTVLGNDFARLAVSYRWK